MGYKIKYGYSQKGNYSADTTRKSWQILIFLSASVMCIIILTLALNHKDAMLDLLLPGDYPTTAAAWKEMLTDMRSGTSAKEAVTTFCKEILEYAKP